MSGKPTIVISLGDPAGIGPEITLKALAKQSVRNSAKFVVVGHEKHIATYGKLPNGIETILTENTDNCRITPGIYSKISGEISFASVDKAIELCLLRKADGMVTAPICKAAWKLAGKNYPGHTEFLAKRCNAKNVVMMLAGKGLRVALATIHEPLAMVPKLLNQNKIINVATLLNHSLKKYFNLKTPRIAVLGLNPHAGEDGHIGKEESKIIIPAIKKIRSKKINAIGPLPADTVFHAALKGNYDAILAMYHDQGLAPLKTVAFDCGVNITLGLPIIRTSPDHGTAFDIAGKNKASETSMVAAIKTAIEMTKNI